MRSRSGWSRKEDVKKGELHGGRQSEETGLDPATPLTNGPFRIVD